MWDLNVGIYAASLSAVFALVSACFGGRLALVTIMGTAPTLAGSVIFGVLNHWQYVGLGESLIFGVVASVPAFTLARYRAKNDAVSRLIASIGISLVLAVASVSLLAAALLPSAYPLWTGKDIDDLQLYGAARITINNVLLMMAASAASWPLWRAHLPGGAMLRPFLIVAILFIAASLEEAAVIQGIGSTDYILFHNFVVTVIVVCILLGIAEFLRRRSRGVSLSSLF